MLITPTTPRLTVRRISQHLGVREWTIARELKLGAAGDESRLHGEKVTGTGRVGQGGQWQVLVEDYLTWLGVPQPDREFAGDDGLPLIYRFDAVAKDTGITTQQLTDFVEGNGLDYLRVGKNRYLTHLQRIRFESLHRAKTSASR